MPVLPSALRMTSSFARLRVASSRLAGSSSMPRRCSSPDGAVEVVVVVRPRVDLVLDAVQAGGQDHGHRQVRVARAVHGAVLDMPAGHPQHLRAVVRAVGDEDRRPGGPRGGRAGRRRQPLVAVHRRRRDRDVGLRVLQQAAGEVVAELREPEPVRRRPRRRTDRAPVGVPQATCGSGRRCR